MPIGQEAAERSEGHRVAKRALESNEAFLWHGGRGVTGMLPTARRVPRIQNSVGLSGRRKQSGGC